MLTDFHYLCNVFCQNCLLYIPVSGVKFGLQTDASVKGVSGVLCVKRQSLELPIAFFSRQLRDRERKYAATELECLAVLESVKHFEVYLHDQHLRVETDHRALEGLLRSRNLNDKLTRWAPFLQQFNMEIVYRPGTTNQNADGLSRQAWDEDDLDTDVNLPKQGEMSWSFPDG